MEQYKIIHFKNTGELNEILIALLSNENFDSFEEKDNELIAYIKKEDLQPENISHLLQSMPALATLQYEISDLENKNWNAEWEKNFEAITIDEKCTIRAPFHAKTNAPYQIEIEPKMAFGTGHHATTAMMISLMLNLDFKDKNILDFGCGTGILSVLAEKMGAKSIFANDIEQPAFENVTINTQLNQCTKISNNLGGIEIVPQTTYDIILANVNTRALLENLKHLQQRMHQNSKIMLSGILIEQKESILAEAKKQKMQLIAEKEQEKWTALLFQK